MTPYSHPALLSRIVGALLLSAIVFIGIRDVNAQTSSNANADLYDLKSEIQADQARLLATEREEVKTKRSVNDLSNQIKSSRARVSTFRNRLDNLTLERDSLFRSIDEMADRLSRLKSEYRSRAIYAYKFGRLHDIALILSAGSINQMLIRIQYLHRFSTQRKGQLLDIQDASEALKVKRETLQRTLFQNEVILQDAERAAEGLTILKKSHQSEIRRLEAQKQLLSTSLDDKLSEMNNLVALVTVSADPSRAKLAESILRTTRFEASKGALPWPVFGGIKEPFGRVVNPDLGTTTDNVGIIIETGASSEIAAVFEGHVRLIDVMPGLGRVVFVEHGDYLSVYGNFSLLYVGKGDTIRSGQILGRSGTDAEPRGRTAFFGIFHNGEPIDPQDWLSN